ncbi:RNA polymerase sigma factor SigD [Thalassoglobus neptunius]|uniref:RNA polymerase sigma factor SigD n=1 Tax=Thalassoglobus neptunius TaxID=1938619 RepID=A0A5C5WNX3_9PLAN|nr:sigma-70 family RNA polymerase sigma factor [Thalassoglobus neptunius]TWT51925.1 RNA polymerase sigma factor SigD [Thalassoglobus neptunius]
MFSNQSIQYEQLAEAAESGDQSALAELFELYKPRLQRMVELRLDRRLQRRVDSGDVVQDAYVNLQQKFSGYLKKRDLPLFLWFRLEVGQKLIDVHRHHLGVKMRDVGQEVSLHIGGVPSVASITLAEHLMGRLSTVSQAAMKAEVKIKVQDALNTMDENDREMLVLRHFEELSNSESALALGISPTAACNRYVRALKRLRQVFERMPGGIESLLG